MHCALVLHWRSENVIISSAISHCPNPTAQYFQANVGVKDDTESVDLCEVP